MGLPEGIPPPPGRLSGAAFPDVQRPGLTRPARPAPHMAGWQNRSSGEGDGLSCDHLPIYRIGGTRGKFAPAVLSPTQLRLP